MRIISSNKNGVQTTVAIMTDTENEARNKVIKVFELDKEELEFSHLNILFGAGAESDIEKALCMSKLKMNRAYKAVVKCLPVDTPDKLVGESEAIKKVKKNFNKAVEKAYKRWQIALLKKIKQVSPETFGQAVAEVYKNEK